jgi:hypothetical protein
MKPEKMNIISGLQRIRLKRRVCLAIIFGFLPGCVVLGLLGPIAAMSGALGLFLVGLWVQHRLNRSLCPRCHKLFFVVSFDKNHYRPDGPLSFPPQRNCRHCNLELYKKR